MLALASCSSRKEACELYEYVNTAIDTNPESALQMLDSISRDIDRSDEDIACHFNLLLIKAKDKAYIHHESDSVILSVIPYFEKHTEHLPEAYYYAGRVYSDMGDAPEALNYFEKSLELLPEDSRAENVLKQKSVLFSQLGGLEFYQSLVNEGREYFIKALACDKELHDSTNVVLDYLNICYTCNSIEEQNHAIIYLDSAEFISRQLCNEELLSDVMCQKAMLFYKTQEYDKALDCFATVSKSYTQSKSSHCGARALIYDALGMQDSASYYWNKVLEYGDIHARIEAYAALANYANANKDIDKAASYLNSYIECSDSINAQQKIEAVTNIQHIYNYHHKENEINKLRISEMQNLILIWCLVFAVVTISLVALLTYRQMRVKQLNSDLQMVRYRQLEEQLLLVKNETQERQNEKAKFSVNASGFVSRTKALINEEKLMTSQDWDQVRTLLDESFPSFLTTLCELRHLNETDMQICMLLKFDLSPASIAKLIGRDKSTVTAARKKLFMKTFGKEGRAKDWDMYILSL